MMTIVATLNTNDTKNNYFIEQKSQNSLKGLVWGVSGSVLTSGALALTACTIGVVGAAALSSLGTVMNDNLRNSIGGFTVPAAIGLAGAALAVDYIAVKFTGYCLSNAIHHLGPELEIVRHKKAT